MSVQVHVIDASSPSALQQRRTVLDVLTKLGMTEQCFRTRTVEVWNKVDRLIPGETEEWSNRWGNNSREEQRQLWQLVQSHLQHEFHQSHSSAASNREASDDPTHCDSSSEEEDDDEKCNLDGSRHAHSTVQDLQVVSESASEYGINIESDDDCSTNHSVCSGTAGSDDDHDDSRLRQGSNAHQSRKSQHESERLDWKRMSGCRHRGDADEDCSESSKHSSRVGLQESWSQRDGTNSDRTWGSTVVVAAKTGLGLTWLTELIVQKLRQHCSSSRV
jgi:hypothetical protein